MPDIDAEKRFTALDEASHRQVHAYVVSRGGRLIADEVVNRTFTVAWTRFAEVPDLPLPWLLRVARNLLLEQARSARGKESLAHELQAWTTRPRSPPQPWSSSPTRTTHRLRLSTRRTSPPPARPAPRPSSCFRRSRSGLVRIRKHR